MGTPPPPSIPLAEAEDAASYCVTVLPPPDGVGHDQCFPDYLVARCHARLLCFGNGWKIVDRVDPKIRKAAEAADLARRGHG
jgi:hypothetical protein